MSPGRTPISALILTKDEERHIERCIRSVSFADEVLVIDSGSADATQQIARQAGARVIEQEWLGYSRQRNAGGGGCIHDWVLWIDADEVVSHELHRSISAVLEGPMDPRDGYVVERRNDFLACCCQRGAAVQAAGLRAPLPPAQQPVQP